MTDEELEEELAKRTEQSSEYATVEEYKAAHDPEQVREQLLYDKVMDYLVANNSAEKE